MQELTHEEQERAVYIAGDIRTADLLDQIQELEKERDALRYELDSIPSEEERNQDSIDLEDLKRFFYDCFERLGAHYPCPEFSSDYDKNVIFEAIAKGEGVTD
jgi:hypothetical protein